MRKVFVVLYQYWDDTEVISVHSTEKAAARDVKQLNRKTDTLNHRYEAVPYRSRKRDKRKST